MNKITKYGLFSMALLAGMAAFTACSSDEVAVEDTAPVNPSYNGETVKTEFAINIPHANTNKRMTESNAQGGSNPTFLGMEGINLIPLNIASPGIAGEVTGSENPTTIIRLANIASAGLEMGSSPGSTTEGRKIYSDVEIPTGTNTFLFYGQALYSTTYANDAARYFAQGALETSLDDGSISTVNDIAFNLKQIMSSATTEFTAAQDALLTQLNTVMNAKDGSNNKWSDQQDGTETPTPDPAPSEDEKTLARLYKNMTTTMKAGSANSIKIALEQLYNAVNDIAKKTGSPESEQTAIAKAIQAAIATTGGATGTPLFNASGDDTNGYTLAYKNNDNTAKFPGVFNLPEGAVQLAWDDGTGFAYVNASDNSGNGIIVGSGDNIVQLNSLTYPASLAYYISTAAQTNDDPAATFPDAGNWGSAAWTGWESSVQPSTRLVALKNNIQYGVAQLATTVKFANNNVEDQKGNSVVVGATSFTLTGILVGGQPVALNYELMPAESTTFNRTVYDNITTPLSVTTNNMTTPNYTLLLDNKGAGNSGAEADEVNFALEMTNNGDAFYGVDGGLIANGMKFYLVGTLNKASGGNAGTPAPSGVDHIFMQDYKTTATVTISSLKNAYVTIPDLRATNLQLGLSVDLEWQKGYTFNVSID